MNAPLTALVALVALVVLSASGFVRPVVAGAVPDPVWLTLMRRAVAATPQVRVRGDLGTQMAYRPWLDSSGVLIEQHLGGRHGAMRTAVPGPSQSLSIPWHEISTIEIDRAGYAGKATLIGGAVGLFVGSMIYLSNVWIDLRRLEASQPSGTTFLAVTGTGVALGFLIGQHGKRRTIYPPPSPDRH